MTARQFLDFTFAVLVDRHDQVTRNAALLALIGQRDAEADVLAELDSALSGPSTDPAARRAQIATAVLAAGGE